MKSLEGVQIDGSGNVNIPEWAFDALDLEINGSGDIQANGTAEILDVRLDGSGNINCADLTAHAANVVVNGSGSVKIDVTDSLEIDISGSGSVRYSGNPSSLQTSISGSGSIKKILAFPWFYYSLLLLISFLTPLQSMRKLHNKARFAIL